MTAGAGRETAGRLSTTGRDHRSAEPPPGPDSRDPGAAPARRGGSLGSVTEAYFHRVADDRYRATAHTGGAWSETEQHIAPLCGLVVHAIERFAGEDGLVVGRVTFDILGVIAIEEFDIAVETVRPGRTIALLEAVVTARGRTVLRARAWRLAGSDTSAVSGGQPDPIPAPADVPAWPMSSRWPGGFIASVDVRRVADTAPGRTTAWVDTPLELLAGEEVSTLARFVGLVDTANGVSVRESPEEWMFPNLDLSVHLYRLPVPGPVGLQTDVVFGPDGQGLTSAVLHDLDGPVGRAAQILTVRPLSPAQKPEGSRSV